jgi:hypothetical protein
VRAVGHKQRAHRLSAELGTSAKANILLTSSTCSAGGASHADQRYNLQQDGVRGVPAASCNGDGGCGKPNSTDSHWLSNPNGDQPDFLKAAASNVGHAAAGDPSASG